MLFSLQTAFGEQGGEHLKTSAAGDRLGQRSGVYEWRSATRGRPSPVSHLCLQRENRGSESVIFNKRWTHSAPRHIALQSILPHTDTPPYLCVHRHMTRVLSSYRLKHVKYRQSEEPAGSGLTQETTWHLLTFTGWTVKPVAAPLAGHAPETGVTGTCSVTKVTVVTFTTVTAGRAHAARTHWEPIMMSSLIYSWCQKEKWRPLCAKTNEMKS